MPGDPSPENDPPRQPLLVIGAGMAAYSLIKRLVDEGGLKRYAITLIGEEPVPCYDRVNLTKGFGEVEPEDLLLAKREWYEEQGVSLRTGVRVERIDRANRQVMTTDGEPIPYQHLVLATGSRPFVPPLEGSDLPGVFVYRTMEDIARIREHAEKSRSAVVLGGGLLGLEAAKALDDLGLKTTVAEVAASLMPRQLNAEAGDLLKEEIEKLDVDVLLPRRSERIEQSDGQLEVSFQGHDSMTVDAVVISAGIRPRDELADDADLERGERGGFAVDEFLRTSDPCIHAIGECASFDGKLYGLVGPCYDMARIVADNLIAQANGRPADAKFAGASSAARLKLMGVDVATLGLPIGEAAGATAVISRGEGYCRTLLIENRRLVGAIGVGDWPEHEQLSNAIQRRRRVTRLQQRRFQDSGSLWPNVERDIVSRWPAAATVCSCLNITRGELSAAMAEGATTEEALAEATGASTVCGSCKNLLCELAGQPAAAGRPAGRLQLLFGAGLALVVLAAVLIAGPTPLAETVQSSWRSIDWLWRESFARQITGYVLLAISVIALGISLRKRVSWIRLGEFGTWRGLHGLIGAATLIGFAVHTGMRLGHNFTFVLAAVFLLLNLLGAVTGVTASLEADASGAAARQLRAWRPRLTRLHLWLFWPLPALVLFHIISVYYY